MAGSLPFPLPVLFLHVPAFVHIATRAGSLSLTVAEEGGLSESSAHRMLAFRPATRPQRGSPSRFRP